MVITKHKLPSYITCGIILLTLIWGILLFLHPPALFPDPAWGFQVLRSMEHGTGFNLLTGPDRDDLSQNYSEFISWWSPGQYLVPGFFRKVFGLNYGQASAVTVSICEILAITGFYTFFKKIGFTPLISALSIAFIACQPFFIIPYVFYNGGETLLFAFAGWFLYGCFAISRTGVKLIFFVLLSGWIGFICKSSFMWIYACGSCCLWIRLSGKELKIWQWIKTGLWIGIPAVISLAAIYMLYLSKGLNPASVGAGVKLMPQTFGFPIAAPILSGFSVDELTGGLFYHPDGHMFSQATNLLILAASAIISIILIVTILKRITNRQYRLLVVLFYGFAILFFGYTYLKQAAITYEGRHLRLIGLIVVPGIIYLVAKVNRNYKILFGLVWAAIACYSFTYLYKGYTFNKEEGILGTSGVVQQFIDQPSMNQLMALDRKNKNAIFAFLSPDLGIEVQHNRIITLETVGPNATLFKVGNTYGRHYGPLYITIPVTYLYHNQAQLIMQCFPDYKRWEIKRMSEDYVLLSAL